MRGGGEGGLEDEGEMGMKKPHALVVVFPAQGHIVPITELCIRLAASDGGGAFRITLANIGMNHHASIQRLRSVLGPRRNIRVVEIPCGDDAAAAAAAAGQHAVPDICAFFRQLEHQRALVEIVAGLVRSEPPITCVLTDLYTPFTRSLARFFGLPRIVFCPQSAATLACYQSILRREPPPTIGDVVDYIPGVAPLEWAEVTTSIQSLDPDDVLFQTVNDCLDSIDGGKGSGKGSPCAVLLVNTFRELEDESLSSVEERLAQTTKVFDIGPVLPRWYLDESDDPGKGQEAEEASGRDRDETAYQKLSVWNEDYECLQWLDNQQSESVLFVSFGSVVVLSRAQFAELALGLEMSGAPVLWVIRPDSVVGIEDEPIAFPDGYLERMRDRLRLVSWAPQKQVLLHRATGAFLTHCGWNSTLESICAGVPVLGLPFFADQRLNCRQCVDRWHVGLQIQLDAGSDLATREEVCRKVRMLMNRPSDLPIRDNARTWKRKAQAAAKTGGSSDARWNEFVQLFAQFDSLTEESRSRGQARS